MTKKMLTLSLVLMLKRVMKLLHVSKNTWHVLNVLVLWVLLVVLVVCLTLLNWR